MKPRIVFDIDYTSLQDKMSAHYERERKNKKELKAYCTSQACAPLKREGQTVYMKPKPNAEPKEFWCPDCGFALFWD